MNFLESFAKAGVQLIHLHGAHNSLSDAEKDKSPARVTELFLVGFIPRDSAHHWRKCSTSSVTNRDKTEWHLQVAGTSGTAEVAVPSPLPRLASVFLFFP